MPRNSYPNDFQDKWYLFLQAQRLFILSISDRQLSKMSNFFLNSSNNLVKWQVVIGGVKLTATEQQSELDPTGTWV